jgi:hypothetical protein
MAKMIKKAADGYTNYGSKAGKPSPVTDYAGKPGKQDSYTQYKKGGVIKKKAQNGKDVELKMRELKQKAASDTSTKKGMNFDKKSFDSLPKLKTKAKNGTSFGMLSVKAGVDKNPKPTAADRIAGAKGMAKKGAKVATKKYKSGGTVSMQLGSYTRQIGKNYSGKAKMGKSMGKCKNGC